MDIYTLPWSDYSDTGPFTHMLGGDLVVWRRFIQKFPDRFDRVVYDVHVGKGTDVEWTRDPEVLGWAKHLTQLRIDVLAFKGEELTVIEVRRLPGLASFGQIMGYAKLLVRDFKLIRFPDMMLISEWMGRDIRWLCELNRVKVMVMEDKDRVGGPQTSIDGRARA